MKDWEKLSHWLNIDRSTINNINKNCPSFHHAQCQWRELVETYCDMSADGDPYKTAADIAVILDSKMYKKKQAWDLKQLVFTSEFVRTK